MLTKKSYRKFHFHHLYLFISILGHVFENEGLRDAQGKLVQERHCVNSVSLQFEKKN